MKAPVIIGACLAIVAAASVNAQVVPSVSAPAVVDPATDPAAAVATSTTAAGVAPAAASTGRARLIIDVEWGRWAMGDADVEDFSIEEASWTNGEDTSYHGDIFRRTSCSNALLPTTSEPADGKIILSAWLDTADTPTGRDKFSLFNARIGRNTGAFQLTQRIPLTPSPWAPGDFLRANMTLFDEKSDAALFLTVYPYPDLKAVTDQDIQLLTDQVYNITQTGRNVFIRYGPEMQGSPPAYIAQFQQVATSIHAKCGDKAAMVWAPNLEQGGDAEAKITPYYPGDDYVDWVGLSVYYKGMKAAYPWKDVTRCPDNYFAEIIDGLGGEGPNWSFYKAYAQAKNKPFLLAEGAAAYHVSYRVGSSADVLPTTKEATQPELQMSWWNSFLFSDTFHRTYPLFKMANLFEFEKEEDDGNFHVMRDFRTSVDNATLAEFVAGLRRFDSAFQWAASTVLLPTTSVATTTTSSTTTTARTTSTTTAAPKTTATPPAAPSSSELQSASVKAGAAPAYGSAAGVVGAMAAVVALFAL
ncbi:hypothetical protein HDU96_002565 [Phlyctochytrium bullatum]|nr:hypothetical protein HDU96_002565 [Phlyctochytrium bullatum]